MRSTVLLIAIATAGCGKSFQEADAIYKDEAAKLDALEDEISDEAEAAFKAAYEKYLTEHDYLNGTESQASDAAAEAMTIAAKELEAMDQIEQAKAQAFSEAMEEPLRLLRLGLGGYEEAQAEKTAAEEAYLAARNAKREAMAKAQMAVQESEEATAAMKAMIEEAKRKAVEVGKKEEKDVRKRRSPEIEAQRKIVDAAFQAKEAAK